MITLSCDKCHKEVKKADELSNRSFNEKIYALCDNCNKELDAILAEIDKELQNKVGAFLNNGTGEK